MSTHNLLIALKDQLHWKNFDIMLVFQNKDGQVGIFIEFLDVYQRFEVSLESENWMAIDKVYDSIVYTWWRQCDKGSEGSLDKKLLFL